MHRSPLTVLVIAAAMAGCSTHDGAPAATELLAQDSTLAARLAMAPTRRPLALPEACGTVDAARPATESSSRAGDLARRGYDAESLGNLPEARSLLRRASQLDATNGSAAYHLGRTSEALGDRVTAVRAYCRFLTLAPTSDASAETRQRVATLSQPGPRVAADERPDIGATPRAHAAPARREARRRPAVEQRVAAHASVARSLASSGRDRGTASVRAVASSADDATASPAERDRVISTPEADHGADRTVSDGDVVAAPAQSAGVLQPATASRTSRGGWSRAQRAGVGAAAGAIIGAATGRSVKGAIIGAAAGGVFGSVLGGGSRPTIRGIRG